MRFRDRFLALITDPNIAYILMMVGMLGIFFELAEPGVVLPGVIGGISLILAFFAFQSLPINWAGVLLILFGVALLIAEIKVVSHGVLTVGRGQSPWCWAPSCCTRRRRSAFASPGR